MSLVCCFLKFIIHIYYITDGPQDDNTTDKMESECLGTAKLSNGGLTNNLRILQRRSRGTITYIITIVIITYGKPSMPGNTELSSYITNYKVVNKHLC